MLNTDTLPEIAAVLVILAILVPSILLLFTYRKYKRVAALLPDPQSLQETESGDLDKRHAALTTRLLEDWADIPDDEVERARHALWTSMLLLAASDGSIDHREMRFVADLFGRMGGTQMDFRPVVHAAEYVHRDRKMALTEIGRAKDVGSTAKQQILAGAFLVSMSDHALAPQETDCLIKIADALGLSAADRKTMLSGITQRFEG